jgi:RNA polymerase sigma factor (sigma-70 family)
MSRSEEHLDLARDVAGSFTTTHWSVVARAGEGDSPAASLALERLCQSYWYPLYVFVRRQGHSYDDAQDLTQEFFARFLERKYVELADQSRGRFRTFLLRSMEHFLINEWTKGRAAKRGGSQKVISWDEREAETRYLAESSDQLSPDKIFEKRWATNLLERVLARLGGEFSAPEKRKLFDILKQSLGGENTTESYQTIGIQLGMTEGAVKVAVHRLRHRYRELLRAEVAETVATQAEVDEELRYLISVIRS